MALTTTISQRELKRQAALVFEGKPLRVMLCLAGASGYTAESTVANWQAQEVSTSGTGYSRFSATLATGSYNSSTQRYELPAVDADFSCTTSYSYDTIVLYFSGETYIHSLLIETPNITLAPGQVQTYRFTFLQDEL